jgi:hypothetical protein
MGIELILLSVAVAAAPVLVVFTATFQMLKNWFQSKGELKAHDKDIIAFSIREALEDGAYDVVSGVFGTGERIVQGFYDQRTEQVVEARRIRAAKLDASLLALHEKPLAVWE